MIKTSVVVKADPGFDGRPIAEQKAAEGFKTFFANVL